MRRMTAADFIAKWGKAELKERSAAQEHFLDLCALFGHPTPAQADPTGESFCFEKDAAKHGGGDGFADVWKKGFFGWEYKGKHKDLTAAYDQLLLYRDALANPPLLVACDLDRIVVHTNFTNTVSARHEIPLKQLGEPRSQEILRAVFFQPDLLRPGRTSEAVTQEAAEQFAGIAEAMRLRGLPPAPVAHFLNRLVFCLFAEDIGLLPVQIFTRIVDKAGGEAEKFARFLGQLFEAMAKGGEFGLESIRHFNGNLFDDASVPPLVNEDIQRIAHTVRLDWSAVDPSIFGTLFERGLDPAKRSQLGAHYTSRVDIEKLVEPVVMDPLRQEWRDARDVAERLIATGQKKAGAAPAKPMSAAVAKKAKGEADSILHRFLMRLHAVRVLDPACGSGNFLYVTLQKLKDLEKEVILFAMQQGLGGYLPMVGPWQLHGIELNPYAHDLAQTAVWIGFLQWTRANGFQIMQTPILRTMTGNFQCRDSILNADGSEPEWPAVDFIVGNPPFLGDKMMRRELGDEYVDRLRTLFHGRLPGQSDLCCYWFEKARAQLAAGKCKRAGLLATQGIRGGANREVLKRIKESGDIFWAISDKDWALDGANVHVSLIAFDAGQETERRLDGALISVINANLTAHSDTASASPLASNHGVSFIGASMHGPFPVPESVALEMLRSPNPHGRPNSDVVRPWVNGLSITRRAAGLWIVDFPPTCDVDNAALYEMPFEYVRRVVKPLRDKNRRAMRARNWWLLGDPQKAMREAVRPLSRYLGTARVAKHKLFTWFGPEILPTDQVVVFARDDDYFFGVLQSRIHEAWALKLGTQLETRPRYTPTTCFETFPFPEDGPKTAAISAAARGLSALRDNWLNPPEWTREEVLEFPGAPGGQWSSHLAPGTGTVRYSRLVPKDESCGKQLRARTLTALYNKRPQWLADAHTALDAAVCAAYGWPTDLSDAEILSRLLDLNRARAT